MTVRTPPSSPTTPGAPAAAELPKQYRPVDHESRIWSAWESSGAFHADPSKVLPDRSNAYSIVIPPPNVTDRLHLGHAFNNTLQDILVRAHRMMGFETLWMPGTDHAGIATQAVVERRLKKEQNLTRQQIGREAFVAKVQAFKDEYEATITEQLKRMGCSCDWARQRFTMDEVCARAVREAFFRLFKDGLIYRGKRLVNWDPALQTAVSDDECYEEEIDGHFYYLRYPLVHPHGATTQKERNKGQLPPLDAVPVTWSELESRGYPGAENHSDEEQAYVTVATTRPETYLGDTAVAVNPHDPRAKSLRGLCVELPLVGRVIPIVEDAYVVLPSAESPWGKGLSLPAIAEGETEDPKAAFATGFLKVTPAHDANDYELYHRHKEAMDTFQEGTGKALINIFAPDATVSDKHGWTDVRGAHIFVGKKREEARRLAVEEFKARTVANGATAILADVKPYRHTVKHSDRSKAVIEPYLSDQWYVKVTDPRMAPTANRSLVPDQRTSGATANAREGMNPEREQSLSAAAGAAALTGHSAGASSSEPAGDGSLRFYPSRYAKTYENWHDNIRDWCISRQLWWGHRIPVWTKQLLGADWGSEGRPGWTTADSAQMTGVASVRITQNSTGREIEWDTETLFFGLKDHVDATESYTCHVCLRENDPVVQELTDAGFRQDPDVLDTWFSSALWPMSTMGWPDAAQAAKDTGIADFEKLLPAFNPTSTLCTAREIITLWVSRMVMFNRYFMPEGWAAHSATRRGEPLRHSATSSLEPGQGRGPVPFHDVFIHSVIQDGEGKKMSKTAGNGLDPLDIIASHGTDAMRFALCHMATQTQDVRMPVEKDPTTGRNTSKKFDNGRNFANKLWNAARFVIERLSQVGDSQAESAGPDSDWSKLSLVDRWMLSRLHAGVQACTAALKAYEYSDYAQTLYRLVWDDFCDWYLESIKPTVGTDCLQRAVLGNALSTLLRLAHPVMPFVTEAIYERLGALDTVPALGLRPPRKGNLLCTAGWPEVSSDVRDEEADAHFARLQALVTAIREVKAQHQVNPKRRITLHAPHSVLDLIAPVRACVYTLGGLERDTTEAPPAASVAFRFEGLELHVSGLADAVDSGAEKARLEKQTADLEKSITTLTARLANPGYTERAPAPMVQQTRDQLAKAQSDLAAARDALAKLG